MANETNEQNNSRQRPAASGRMAAPPRMNNNIRQTPRLDASARDDEMRRKAQAAQKSQQGTAKAKSTAKKKTVKTNSNFSTGMLIIELVVLCIVALIIYLVKGSKNTVSSTDSTGTAATSSGHGVEIWEAMTSNKGTVPDGTGLFPDWIELHNTTDDTLNVGGFGLTDDVLGEVKWTIPTGTKIEPNGYLVIWCSGEPDRGAMHASFRISASDTVSLSTETGTIIQQVKMKSVAAGMSLGVDASGNMTEMLPSPGFPNTEEGQQAFLATLNASANDDIGVYLNEFQPSNASTILGPDGTYCDWIELYNTTSQEVDLSGFGISDTLTEPLKYVMPQGTKIPPQGLLLIYCTGRESPIEGIVETPFKLSAYKEEVVFATPQGKILDSISYNRMESDTSMMRSPDGTGSWNVTSQPTPGYPNTEAGLTAFMNAGNFGTGDLIISEVLAANYSTMRQADLSFPDWIELYNKSGSAINLAGYALSPNAKNPAKWVFPDVTIGAGEYLVVLATGNNVTDTQKKNLETNFGISAEGDKLFLFSPEGELLDKLTFGRSHADVSYGRTDRQLLYYSTPTPGAANGAGSTGYSSMPSFGLEPGYYTSAQTVEIKVPAGYTATYTIDGSEPKESSQQYVAPIAISGNTVIRARCFKSGLEPSDIATATYFIHTGADTMESHETKFAIISLVTEPDNLFGTKNGIYVAGEDFAAKTGEEATSFTLEGDTANVQWKLANFNAQHQTHPDPLGLEWTRPVHMEIVDEEGKLEYSDDVMFRIFGAYSRFKSQKSMAIVTKAGYGATSINDKVFKNRDYTDYQAIVLRNSAMDCFMSKIRDILIQGLLEDGGSILPTQAYRRAIVYMNGRYWGLYNIREKVNKYFLAQHYGISDPDTIDILVGNGTTIGAVINGENSYVEYKELIDWVSANDLSQATNYAYIQTKMDVENFAEYCAMEIFVGNTDTGNIKFWKSAAYDNKWRWIPYDFDWAFNRNDDQGTDVTSGYRRDFFKKYFHEKGHGVAKGFSTVLSRGLLKNDSFRALFLQKCALMYNEIFTTEKMLARIDELKTEMADEITYDTERWDGYSMKTWERSIENLQDSAKNAPEYFLKYCQAYFNLSESDMIKLFGKVSSK